MGNKIGSDVYVKHFKKKLKVENLFVVGDEKERYVYQVSYQGTRYILKGFKIRVEHFDLENRRSVEIFEQNLMKMSEIFQEYYFARAASLINPHIAKPLSLDLEVELAKDPGSFYYLHVQMIFEYGGAALNKLQSITIDQGYNLMRQSANALLLFHNLEIAHFDIKPANMVYDAEKDLLKILNMGSAFGGSNRKKPGAITKVSLKGKVTAFTPEFAPPEVLVMENTLIKKSNMKSFLPEIDVYCWAMSFFAIFTNRTNTNLKDYIKNYKTRSEGDYKEFMQIVKDSFGSLKPESIKEAELMKVVSNLLTRALEYEPKERPIIKDAIREMKEFEKKKNYTLSYSKTELEYNEELLNFLISNDDVDSYLKELLNKNEDEEEVKTMSQMVNNRSDLLMSLHCNHEVNKDKVIEYALKLFINRKAYKYRCFCEECNKVVKLRYISLYCGCTWTKLKKKIKFKSDLTKADYGKCSKGHPLTSIDLGLVNDFLTFKFTSLMISDCPKEKEEVVNLFNSVIEKEKIENIVWILRYTKALTKLYLSDNKIEDECTKAIGEALKYLLVPSDLQLRQVAEVAPQVTQLVLQSIDFLAALELSP